MPNAVVARASIDAPASIPAGGDLLLLADKSGGVTFSWKLISPKVPFLTLGNGEAAAIRGPAPGVYRFVLIVTGSAPGSYDFDFADILVPSAEPTPTPTPAPVPPPPDPPPQPSPDPSPAPTPGFAGHIHATLVFDLDEPSTAQLRASTVAADLLAMNATWYAAASGGTVAKIFAKIAPNDGLPVVYFTDDLGNLRGTLKAPTTKAAVIAKLTRIRWGDK